MSLLNSHLYEFHDFRIDLKERILVRDKEPVELTPKAFDLLSALVENHGRLIEKDELMSLVWADSFVEESNLTFNIRQLRKSLGDHAQNPTYIKTVPRHGYRFIAPVVEVVNDEKSSDQSEQSPPIVLPDREGPRVSENKTPDPAHRFSRSIFFAAVFMILLVASLVAAASLIWRNVDSSWAANVPILAADFESEQLTETGGVKHAVLSPDGRRMAYTSTIAGSEGIWIRELETAENVQIVAGSGHFYHGLSFSPDGQSVYFARGNHEYEVTETSIYKVSVIGGIPKEVISKTESWFGLSPDGRRISFVRCPHLDENFCSLYVADADGTNERRLLTRPRPIWIQANQFSPDGRLIAFASGHTRSRAQDFELMEVDIHAGTERRFTSRKFFRIQSLSWLPDQSGLLATVFEEFYQPIKIFHFSARTDEVTPLNKDGSSYYTLSLDQKAEKMIATQALPKYRLWTSPVSDPKSAKTISFAFSSFIFTPSGRIIYTSTTDGNLSLWIMNADGTEQKQLTSGRESNWQPRVSSDEKYIYFASNRTGSRQIWRMNIDGSERMQMSEGEGGIPIFVSADGGTIYYYTSLNFNLAKITSGENGYVTTIVSSERMEYPMIDPSERLVAYFSRKSDGRYQLIVKSIVDQTALKTFEPANQNAIASRIIWAKDGKSFFYVTTGNSGNVVWRQSLDAEKPERFADLGDEEVADFSFSPDGLSMAFIRGKWHHDAFLIEGLK